MTIAELKTAQHIRERIERREAERIEREVVAEIDVERRALIAELAKIDEAEPAIVAQHDKTIENAKRERDRLKAEYEAAERSYVEAEQGKRAALWPAAYRRDVIRGRLSIELRHPAVASALEYVADLREKTRDLPAVDEVLASTGPMGNVKAVADNSAEYKRRSRIMQWCNEAHAQLTSLDSQNVDHADAVAKILASEPR